MIILKCLWSRIECLVIDIRNQKIIQTYSCQLYFCSLIYVVFVSYCSKTVVLKKLDEALGEVNSGSWTVEEMINFITLFIQQTFIEILLCPMRTSQLQLCSNQEPGKMRW